MSANAVPMEIMANHKSAAKEHRQSLKKRTRNRAHRSRLRSEIKRMRKALEAGDVDAARGMLSATHAMIDHSAKLGAIHPNAADRTKARLARAVNRLAAAS
jgi:small subunit ribosomal protein S20